MAINVSQAFHRTSANPVDDTMALTKAQMLTVNDNLMPSKYLTICQDDGFIYLYDKSNTADPETGKFRKFEGGGGGTTYEAGDGIDITGDTISIDPMPAEDMSEVIDEIPSGGSLAVAGYVPLATIISFFGETPPKFFLACDGSTYNKADYPELANHLLSLTTHSQYEVDGDSTKFKVPDLRGEFIRGTGTNSHTNQGNGASVGTHQNGTKMPDMNFGNTYLSGVKGSTVAENADWTSDSTTSNIGGITLQALTSISAKAKFTARPTNTSVMFCIAYKDIYSNPMNDYSTSEKVVGTWIDGKPLYQKTIDVGALPNATAKNVAHNISNLDKVINIIAIAYGSGQHMPMNFPGMDNVANSANVRIMNTNININSGINRSGLSGYVTLQYTKTTD